MTAEVLAAFLAHSVTDPQALIAATGLEATEQQFRAAFERAQRRLQVTRIADEGMRLDAALREMDSPEWKRLTLDQQLERSAFLFRTFRA